MALDYTIIGLRIKQARLNKKLTQAQLSEMIDLSIPFLSRIERGDAHINLTRLTQICDVLDVCEGEILNGTSNGSSSYLNEDFEALLKKCSPEKQKLIYEVAKTIAKSKIDKKGS